MAGILNTTARQFNLKVCVDRRITTLRIAPGMNRVPDDMWGRFKGNHFVNEQIKKGSLKIGKTVDEEVEKKGADTELKSSEKPLDAPQKGRGRGKPKADAPPAPPA